MNIGDKIYRFRRNTVGGYVLQMWTRYTYLSPGAFYFKWNDASQDETFAFQLAVTRKFDEL